MKKNLIIIVAIILISIFLAYQTESPEIVVSNILEDMYNYDYGDYRNVEGYEEVQDLDVIKVKRLRNYFTDEYFETILIYQSMTRMLRFTKAYDFNSSIESLEISIQEPEDSSVRTANYDVVIKFDFLDESVETLYFDLSGSMTLYKKGINWEVNFITSNHRFYQRVELFLRER